MATPKSQNSAPAAFVPPPTSTPLPQINPYTNSKAFIEMVSILYHAEKAALDAFERLTDESVVEDCEVFLRARPMLLADEAAHLRDMENIIRLVGGTGIGPAPVGFAELWDLQRARERLVFPLPSEAAALFTLVAESVGYAYLYHLATATSSPEIAALLWDNVEDERYHIEVSMEVLDRTLSRKGALFDLGLHLCAFLLLSRRAARTMVASLATLRFNPYELAASSLAFTTGVLGTVIEKKFGGAMRRAYVQRAGRLAFSPLMIRAYHTTSYLPEPPFVWPVLRGCVRLNRLASGRSRAGSGKQPGRPA